jgi:chromosome segregation ATPase
MDTESGGTLVMTTVEEAMEQLDHLAAETADNPDDWTVDWEWVRNRLATIRKHIEDQAETIQGLVRGQRFVREQLEQTIEDLTESSQVERAAALVTIEGLQRRIEELETQLKGSSAGMPQTWSGNSWMVEGIADPSEPETPQS